MAVITVIDKELEIPAYSAVCSYCTHVIPGPERTCAAFPGGIPLEIWLGENDHRSPYEGDLGLRFEPQDKEKQDVI